MEKLSDILEYWKSILGFTILIVGGTFSFIAWAEDQKSLMRAEQQLIHNEIYQDNRILRKRDTIQDNTKIITAIESDDDEPSIDEQKLVDSLRQENVRLEADIEEIRALLAMEHE